MVGLLECKQRDDGQEETENRHSDSNDGNDTESRLHLNAQWGLHWSGTNVLNKANITDKNLLYPIKIFRVH